MVRIGILVGVLVGLVALASAGGAAALAPPSPWDGTNPFRCTVQDAGLGTTVPNPGADPYCVSFDKTHQNVDQLGIVDFLSKEPARVAAAAPKCFYFQEDHWRGTVHQGDGTALYEFVGHYFFDKATGDGGAWVTSFTVAGQTFDPTSLPGFPPQYGPYFGPGTGGIITHDSVPADPRCAALAASDRPSVYARPAGSPRCLPRGGHVDRRGVGPVALKETEDHLRSALGPPASVNRGYLHWCVSGGGETVAGQTGDRSGSYGDAGRAPTVIALTSAAGYVLRGAHGRLVRVGSSAAALRRAFSREQLLLRRGRTRFLRLGSGRLLAGVTAGRVRLLGVYDPRALRTLRALRSLLKHAP